MAQGEDPVVMTINGKDVKKSEFEYIYNKNNSENAIDKKTFEEYVTLFKNFKLKVAEAETQGLDTTAAFHKELNEYRSQLAKPYLTSSEIDETLLKEGYEKRKNLREVTNLLILYPEAKNTRSAVIFPSDTLEIYNRAMQIRKRYLAGEKWENLVVENTDDERYKQGDRPGYIGWVSGLRLPVPLAKGIYDTPVGQISLPVRTSYGYHLLVVLAEKPDPGDVHAAHILIPIPGVIDSVSVAEALSKVDTVYTQLKEGVAFEEVAKKYSGDTSSAVRGGDLSWFGVGMMVPEFNDAVFALKEAGDISEPVKTQFGYHIIKLLEKRPPASYEDRKNDLKNNYERSGYSYFLNQPDIEKLKKDNGFSFNENAYKLLYNDAQTLFPTDSLFLDKWKGNNEILYVTGNQPYSIGNFIEYLGQNKRTVFSLSTEVLDELVKNYEYKLLQQAEDQTLEGKYPEFKNLMQEYHDGILLFEVSNKEVWEKSAADTLGLTSFFEKNKDKYAWDKPHYKGYVILAKDSKTKKKMQKEIAKLNVDTAAQYLLDHYKGEEAPLVKIEKGLFIQGENPFVDQIIFKSAKATLPEGFSDFFVTGKLLPELPEAYTDVRGLVITDYQDYLEKEWLESLNKKYSVTIHQNVLNTVK
ncbi:MAG: peptidylprolyl isomerase [Candidatus Symbiothrix sp.]|jgi:peptidyl-prolyl cis-trans isomerase SurA|nr:peptidylprolyl isomerase [Candidatus Symbiothrix sp.]